MNNNFITYIKNSEDSFFFEVDEMIKGNPTERSRRSLRKELYLRIYDFHKNAIGYEKNPFYLKLWELIKASRIGNNSEPNELSKATISLVGCNCGSAKKWVKRIMINPNDEKAAKKIAKFKEEFEKYKPYKRRKKSNKACKF